MVRVGIGMYGISKSPEIAKKIVPVLKWKSVVSQIKTIEKGESVGYSRTFISDKSYTIAIIPLGYADGFKRSLSNGNGGVYIRGNYCPTIGRVCMDMIMVDVTGISAKVGEEVEIIGENQTLEKLAIKLETIPYEIMTSISNRVHRVYIEE
jgi:alanine racemase